MAYLFPKDRRPLMDQFRQGTCSRDLFYGLFEMESMGIVPETHTDWFERRWDWATPLDFVHHVFYRLAPIGFNLGQVVQARKRLDAADLVFASSDSAGLPAAYLRRLGALRVPLVYASIGLTEALREKRGSWIFRFYRNLVRRHTTRVVCYGEQERDELREWFDLEDRKLHLLPFGTDLEFFQPADDENAEGPILSVGRDPMRDWPTLARSLAGLPMDCHVVSHPDSFRGVDLPPNLRCQGEVSVLELRERMRRAPFIVLPVKENAYTAATISLLQAMALGKAVVVSRTGAIGSCYDLRSGENCLLVTPGRVEELRAAILRLWGDPALRASLGARARRTVVEGPYAVQSFAAGLARIFKEALEEASL